MPPARAIPLTTTVPSVKLDCSLWSIALWAGRLGTHDRNRFFPADSKPMLRNSLRNQCLSLPCKVASIPRQATTPYGTAFGHVWRRAGGAGAFGDGASCLSRLATTWVFCLFALNVVYCRFRNACPFAPLKPLLTGCLLTTGLHLVAPAGHEAFPPISMAGPGRWACKT